MCYGVPCFKIPLMITLNIQLSQGKSVCCKQSVVMPLTSKSKGWNHWYSTHYKSPRADFPSHECYWGRVNTVKIFYIKSSMSWVVGWPSLIYNNFLWKLFYSFHCSFQFQVYIVSVQNEAGMHLHNPLRNRIAWIQAEVTICLEIFSS